MSYRSNQALERTAARRAFTFQVIKTVSVLAALALDQFRNKFSVFATTPAVIQLSR